MPRGSNIQSPEENLQIRLLLSTSAAEKKEGNTRVSSAPACRLVWRHFLQTCINVMVREANEGDDHPSFLGIHGELPETWVLFSFLRKTRQI